MIGEIVKDTIIATLGLTVVSFLLIIATTFLSIVVYIIKDIFKNDGRIIRQALISTIDVAEKDDDIELKVENHLQEIKDKVNNMKGDDNND